LPSSLPGNHQPIPSHFSSLVIAEVKNIKQAINGYHSHGAILFLRGKGHLVREPGK